MDFTNEDMKMMFLVSRNSYMLEQGQCLNGSHVVLVKELKDHIGQGQEEGWRGEMKV